MTGESTKGGSLLGSFNDQDHVDWVWPCRRDQEKAGGFLHVWLHLWAPVVLPNHVNLFWSFQGDQEKLAGLPISPLMDRSTKGGMTRSQVCHLHHCEGHLTNMYHPQQ